MLLNFELAGGIFDRRKFLECICKKKSESNFKNHIFFQLKLGSKLKLNGQNLFHIWEELPLILPLACYSKVTITSFVFQFTRLFISSVVQKELRKTKRFCLRVKYQCDRINEKQATIIHDILERLSSYPRR